MSANIVEISCAATSYVTVRKAGRCWDVVLATPYGSGTIRTSLYRRADRETAVTEARLTGARMQRPVRGRHTK